MGITIEKVEAIAAKLRAMPPVENKKREVSKQESIKLLTAEIAAMRERGSRSNRSPPC
jgi:ribosomal protein L6P/L9E